MANSPGVDKTLIRNGGLSYLEIPAVDPRKSAVFYREVLGWAVENADSDEPKFMDQQKHLLGRWITGRPSKREASLLPYFYVDDIASALKHVVTFGGEIVKPQTAESDLWVATVRDPAGNMIGLWQVR